MMIMIKNNKNAVEIVRLKGVRSPQHEMNGSIINPSYTLIYADAHGINRYTTIDKFMGVVVE